MTTRATGLGLSIASAALLLIVAFPASADDWSIQVFEARKHLVKPESLPIHCRSERHIEGCTEFLGEMLRCECRRSDREWSMTARAQLIPYMYVTRRKLEKHEEMHIDHLREQLGLYLGELTARRFDDSESCLVAAEFEMTVFSMRMALFGKLSNVRLR